MADPFEVPPNKINIDLFNMRNPFIRVVTSDEVECLEDKVMDGKNMAHDALLAAMAATAPTSIDFARSFPNPSSETGGRPIHLSIASGFKKVTRPRSKSIPKPAIKFVKEMLQSCKATAPASSAREEEDLQISVEQEVFDLTGHESAESLDVQHEGDEGEMKTNGTKFHICFTVYDKCIMGPDKKVTKLIVDCKWEKVSIQAIYQVATYGLKNAISNMEKGRYSPIYLEVWGESLWRYAILFPKGIVLVEDGEVKASFESGSNFEGLQRTFSRKQAHMQNEYRDAVYPDGSYVLGALFISMKKFRIPNFMGSGCGNHFDTKLFYQSKIRMLVGDRALEWSKADVEDILACREEQSRKLTANFFEGV